MVVALLLLLITTGAIGAEPVFDTVVEAGETINNDVIVFDGDLEIQDRAVVNGDVVVFNGHAEISGTVNGDLVLFNGDLQTTGQASIEGDCVLLNGTVDDSSAAGIRCTTVEGDAFPALLNGLNVAPPVPPIPAVPDLPAVPEVPAVPAIPDAPQAPTPPSPPDFGENSRPSSGALGILADILGITGSSILMGLLAFAVAKIFPDHLNQVKTTVRQKPIASGAVGLLTAVAIPSIVVLLLLISTVLIVICIGLLGFPLAFLIMFVFVAAAIFGWIAVGTWFGHRFLARKGRSFPLTAALGVFLLTLIMGLLSVTPLAFVEVFLALAISFVGLGAVTLTQFGMKAYPRGSSPQDTDSEPDNDKVSSVLETLHIDDDDLQTES